jgi:hypothetical protein
VEEILFYQEPVLKIMEQIGGKEESGRKKKTDGFLSQIWTLMVLNCKKVQEQGVSSLI